MHGATAGECDDGNPCTVNDACLKGACKGGAPAQCDDKDVCTTDYCDPVSGCVHALNQAPCDDGDLCTLADKCGQGKCQPGSPLKCDDLNVCTKDTCVNGLGCVFEPAAGACDDGNPCTSAESCSGGTCVPTAFKDCNDDNVCTKDSCDIKVGCVYENLTSACTDSNVCTNGDVCGGGKCTPGPALACDDGKSCTIDTCDVIKGCVFTPTQDCCTPGQITIDIPFGSTNGWTSSQCCNKSNYKVATGSGDTLSATFQDSIPKDQAVTSVSVKYGIEHVCYSGSPMIFRFNGSEIGTWGSQDGPDCDCGNPAIANATFNAATNLYKGGGATNTLTIHHNADGGCHEAIGPVPGAPAGTAIRVVVGYGCP